MPNTLNGGRKIYRGGHFSRSFGTATCLKQKAKTWDL